MRQLLRELARNLLVLREKMRASIPDVKGRLRFEREAIADEWEKNANEGFLPYHSTDPVPGTVEKLKEILGRFGDAEFFFWGPFMGKWREAVEKALGREVPALDASRDFLRGHPQDPYRGLRLKIEENSDVWDLFEGLWWLGRRGRNTVYVHYEFSPCIATPLLCTLLALGRGRGYVHITSHAFDTAGKALEEAGLKYNRDFIPSTEFKWTGYILKPIPRKGVKVYTVRAEENPHAVLAGRILHHALTTTPLREGEEEALARFMENYLRLHSRDRMDHLRVLELISRALQEANKWGSAHLVEMVRAAKDQLQKKLKQRMGDEEPGSGEHRGGTVTRRKGHHP